MSAKIVFEGLDQLKRDLMNLPAALTDKAAQIIVAHAQEAERLTEGAYPEGPTGNLRRGVSTRVEARNRNGVIATVKSNARHAHLFERGTRERFYNGASRGRMPVAPPSQQMIPIAVQVRRRMYQALAQMIKDAGFEVSQT